ncbi:GNAT family N-acetyltransferase [Rhizobium halophytocola]|uniref:GNAT superfamily N-acetyltransferase n=1 Tax=Rhizobium halophytocola TaxID=735519 RepID=A0ABS4E3W6_9HYPH|nr:GNAT family N-acetyltransferase [Rhizobium halophytocola]MBP1852606.1 GNAT superfamily N-acetyltransferase [Rhizobium halophytocola]
MQQVAVRRLEREDLQDLLALYRDLHPHDPALPPDLARQRFAEMTAMPALSILGGFVGDNLAGSCVLVVMPNLTRGGRPHALIENVVTARVFRRMGVGRAVLAHAVDLALQENCYAVRLMTGSSSPATHSFYAGCGFRPTKQGYEIRDIPAR